MSRVRHGELIALLGAVGLLVLLFLNWFAPAPDAAVSAVTGSTIELHRSGWGALGWFTDVLLALVIFGGCAVAATTARRRSPALPVGVAIVTWTGGALAFFVLLFVLIDQPGLGLSLPNDAVDVRLPAYLGLACAFLVPLGAWIALNDAREDASESSYTPPPPRPIPEA